MFETYFEDNKVYIKNIKNFDLAQTLDCGQAFRWRENANGSWCGVAKGRYIELKLKDGDLIICGSDKKDFQEIWKDYFDLERDYEGIIKSISVNETIKKAADYGSGIRLLNQDPWEALCSFIISQNNNIPRIKGIIERLCEGYGEKCGNSYTFPEAKAISNLEVEDLSFLRAGFRAKYIIDAARKVASGEIDLDNIRLMDFDTARNELMKIKGVGPKVADCVLLFGLGFIEAFPRDVWIKRAMEEFFGGELPECAIAYAGIVQQYIFFYARNNLKNKG